MGCITGCLNCVSNDTYFDDDGTKHEIQKGIKYCLPWSTNKIVKD